MKQSLILNKTLKQTLKINQQLINELDFLKLSQEEMTKIINESLSSNPFLEQKNITNIEELNYLENISSQISLQEELFNQLLCVNEPYNPKIMNYLIYSLNQYGYLDLSLENISHDLSVPNEEIWHHINILQSLEPTGVGAFNMIDSICIQLRKKHLFKSEQLLSQYHSLILNKKNQTLLKNKGVTKKEINLLFEDIKKCNPYPCSKFNNNPEQIIKPDIIVSVYENQLSIEEINQPSLSLEYDLFDKVKENPEMKKYFDDALFLIENINRRNQSVLLISNIIINKQKSYFLYNDQLSPCTLLEISKECGYHESTVSRTLNNKYYSFNGVVKPLKSLLVSKTKGGSSSDSIKKAIILLISNEDKSHPYSDEVLTKKLNQMELQCSRRTVTKYRLSLNIPASSKRKIKL